MLSKVRALELKRMRKSAIIATIVIVFIIICCLAGNLGIALGEHPADITVRCILFLCSTAITVLATILGAYLIMLWKQYKKCVQAYSIFSFERVDYINNRLLPATITLCGSTRFKEEFERVNRELTLRGYIVISVGCFGHSGDTFTEEQKIQLDELHKRKIDLADAICVINKDGYIGSSTASEIEYAKSQNKIITYLEGEENVFDICA